MENFREDKQENFIYIAFFTTSTKMGRFIRFMTRNKYSHVAVSFNNDLHMLYSFSRYSVNAPLVGGFVEESSLRYFYSNDKNIPVKVFAIPLSKERYDSAVCYIEEIKNDSQRYIYNSYSAMLVPFKKRLKIKYAYTCIEFAVTFLADCVLGDIIDKNAFYSIEGLEKILDRFLLKEGVLHTPDKSVEWGNDRYYLRYTKIKVIYNTLKHFTNLTKRLIRY